MESRSWLADIPIAVVLAVAGVFGTAATDAMNGADRPVDVWAFGLVLAASLVVAVRRRWPLATLAVAAAATSTYLFLAYPYGPVFFPFFVAVYTVARHRPPATAVPASGAAFLLLLPHAFVHPASLPGILGIVPASAWVVVPFALGTTVRITREAAAREREEGVRRRVYDERLRIAQEVHDVVGHGLAAIKMQADVALHLMAKKPEQAEQALIAISRTSTEALEEVRATLAVVRGAEPDPARPPEAGLRRLGDLRDRMAEAGGQVDLRITGSPRDLPAAADFAAYRVVQESLTNVLRHSETKAAAVRVGYDADAVVIEVSNPAPGAAPGGGGGLGLPGMRQRVASLGGEFSAGPTADGRFEVRATIPIGGHE
ncbi:sensor histidine kinase [Allosalinactinospora lopnorensis]|uniref:sensor histidine kinase n=1 Tax=Allosalinactinospora lopnorensis TaxID=1352348 RepID=UPI0006992123|nr:histidine kinase [Allosalinactinospora lopnorensis]